MKTVFVTVPINAVRTGEMFTPIEKMGNIIYNKRRRRFERAWQITRRAYTLAKRLHGVAADGRVGIFARGDWAIVERPTLTVDDLLTKYARV